MDDFDAWYAALEPSVRNHVQTAVTLEIVRSFSEQARAQCLDAEENLRNANDRKRLASERLRALPERSEWLERRACRELLEEAEAAVVHCTILSAQALDYLMRTTATLKQAIHLHVMGRT